MVRGTPRAHSSNYIWASLGGGSASLFGDLPELEFCPGDLSGTQDSSEFRGVGGSLCVGEAGRGQARGAGRRRTWVPGAGCAGCGGGGGVWLPRLPGGICMYVWRPQTSCSFCAAGTRGPVRLARGLRARQDAGTPPTTLTAGSRRLRAAFRWGGR